MKQLKHDMAMNENTSLMASIHSHGNDYSNLYNFDSSSTGLPLTSQDTGHNLQSMSGDQGERGTLPPLKKSHSNQKDNSYNTDRSYDDKTETSTDFFGILTGRTPLRTLFSQRLLACQY